MRSVSKLSFFFALAAITLVAFVFRAIDTGNRPMHGDEAVHAEKFKELWETGVYHYDSNEYHGPTIYYAALPSVILHGRHSWPETREADYRLPIAFFGAGMLLFLLPMAEGLGRRAALTAALFIAISPAFVFYSRYFIQEIPFVCVTLGALAFGWRWAVSRKSSWLIGSAVCAGLMIASKETSILTIAAVIIAAVATLWLSKKRDCKSIDLRKLITLPNIALSIAIALVVAIVLVSGFLKNPSGAVGYLRAYAPWFHRAKGDAGIHNHPFYYYLQMLIFTHKQYQGVWGGRWSEALIFVLGAIGAVVALTRVDRQESKSKAEGSVVLWRFIAFYTIALTLIYSLIPYKTPWCLLSFWLGFCLLAGLGVCELYRRLKPAPLRAALGIVLGIGVVQLGNQAFRASFMSNADPNNPYVYAATSADVLKLQERIDGLAKAWPAHNKMVIKVFSTSDYYWPLPWYLRRYPNVGYYSHAPKTKEEAEAEVTLCDTTLDDQLTALLTDDLMNGINEVRPRTYFVETFIRMDVWTTYLNWKNGGVVKKFVPPPPASD